MHYFEYGTPPPPSASVMMDASVGIIFRLWLRGAQQNTNFAAFERTLNVEIDKTVDTYR